MEAHAGVAACAPSAKSRTFLWQLSPRMVSFFGRTKASAKEFMVIGFLMPHLESVRRRKERKGRSIGPKAFDANRGFKDERFRLGFCQGAGDDDDGNRIRFVNHIHLYTMLPEK
jgi:hypothetical protein